MKLKEIKVVIEGITPLMMDRYTEESQSALKRVRARSP